MKKMIFAVIAAFIVSLAFTSCGGPEAKLVSLHKDKLELLKDTKLKKKDDVKELKEKLKDINKDIEDVEDELEKKLDDMDDDERDDYKEDFEDLADEFQDIKKDINKEIKRLYEEARDNELDLDGIDW